MKVLIVDDRDENRYLLESLLKGNGYAVASAVNGAEALERLKNDTIDLIISDILMPVMDGFQLCQQVKTDDRLRTIPFIVYTATYTGPKDEEFARKLGANKFIIKPCEPEVILQHIDEVLAAAKQNEDAPQEPLPQEGEILKLYNERLVRKLEQKMLEAEQELVTRQAAEEALAQATQLTRVGHWYWDLQTGGIKCTKEIYRLLGLKENTELKIDDAFRYVHPEDKDALKKIIQEALHQKKLYRFEYRHVRADNSIAWCDSLGQPVVGPDGEVVALHGAIQDITERKLAEEHRQKLEEQLRHSQKMESIGRLAGGIAHDFNNLLQGILGFGEIMKEHLNDNDPLADYLGEILKAAKNAADLTKQLLAFSRKQIIVPKPIDLNKVIDRSRKMLSRLIGEDVNFAFIPGERLWKTKADPAQIDQILVNLSVNSRDAMPEGGKLTIETANIVMSEEDCRNHPGTIPGEFVMMAVSDTGCGMSKEVQERIFEPFFTTKDLGKGTGLGLSMVYGIVSQHGGFIYLYSELNEGTTFKIYLPRIAEAAEPASAENDVETGPVIGTETILLVEDQNIVRQLSSVYLTKHGYRVLTAANGGEAFLKCENYEGDIHLLLTDVVLPNMNGKELYNRLARLRPGIKVVYMSGYTDDAIVHHGILDPGTFFLSKPFKMEELLRKVREALDAPFPTVEPEKAGTILLFDNDERTQIVAQVLLTEERYEVITVGNTAEGLQVLKEQIDGIDAVLVGFDLPEKDSEGIVRRIRELHQDIPVILVGEFGKGANLPQSDQFAPVHFLAKPFARIDLLGVLKKALPKKRAGASRPRFS
ncbi:MAG TPA: response regulator [bacterium]|nr:response regulator [bacterium]